MPRLLRRLAWALLAGVIALADARAEALAPLSDSPCRNGVRRIDFDDLRVPLGRIQLILSQTFYCAEVDKFNQPDEIGWTARFRSTMPGTDADADEISIRLSTTTSEQILIHSGTRSVVVIRTGPDQGALEALKLDADSNPLRARILDAPPINPHHPIVEVPYWGQEPRADSPLSPLLPDSLPIRVIESPWIDIGNGHLLDARSGATRRFKSEAQAGLNEIRRLGFAHDDRTLLSIAKTQDMPGPRLVVTDTIDHVVQIVPLDAPQPAGRRTGDDLWDISAITPAWILRRFEVVEHPGKALELRPRRALPAARPWTFALVDHTIGLVCVRPAIIPLIIDALQQDWDAHFKVDPDWKDEDAHLEMACPRDRDRMVVGGLWSWYGAIDRASIDLTYYEDGSLELTFLGDKSDVRKNFTRAQTVLARWTFEAVGQYLNEKLREPDWRAQLIEP